jgi:Protein of unknown function (DUF2568)
VDALKNANLGLRFLLELGALAAVSYWGFETGDGALRWLLAIAAPAAVAVVWWLFVSPKAAVDAPQPVRLVVELGVWAAAGAALWATGHAMLAIAFFLVAIVSGVLNQILD